MEVGPFCPSSGFSPSLQEWTEEAVLERKGLLEKAAFKCVFFKLWNSLVMHCSHIRCLSQKHCRQPGHLLHPLKYENCDITTPSNNWTHFAYTMCGIIILTASELLSESTPNVSYVSKLWRIYIHCSYFQLLYLLYCTIVNKLQHINTVTTKISVLLLFFTRLETVFFTNWINIFLFIYIVFFTAFY